MVLRARHRDVEQAAFLLDLGFGAGRHFRRDATVDDVEHGHRRPLPPLGRVDRRQDQIVLVEQGHARLVTGDFRRIECQLRQEALAPRIGRREPRELLDVGQAHRCVFVQPLHLRLVPLRHLLRRHRPGSARRAGGFDQPRELVPGRTHAVRHRLFGEQRGTRRRGLEIVQDACRRLRPHAVQQLHRAESRHAVAQVLRPAQDGQQVLHVRRFEKFEAAELHERNVPPRQFDLDPQAVVRRAEQHRLRLQPDTALAPRKYLLDDESRLVRVVAHRHQKRLLRAGARAPQVLAEALARFADDAVRGIEYRRRGPVVARQCDAHRRRFEQRRKVEDVAHRRAAEAVDGLRVVAHHSEASAVRLDG